MCGCRWYTNIGWKTFDELNELKSGNEQVLLGSMLANGKGSNIPEASVALFVDMHWTPSINLQSENRIDRPEQKNDMTVVYYLTEGEDIIDAHVR